MAAVAGSRCDAKVSSSARAGGGVPRITARSWSSRPANSSWCCSPASTGWLNEGGASSVLLNEHTGFRIIRAAPV